MIFRKSLLFLIIAGVALVLSSCTEPADDAADSIHRITILYTNDEHGWMVREGASGGAAELRATFNQIEGDDQFGGVLVLSGGDMWTGPAISTWFEGLSMSETMNSMDYAAAAIGNHEFDFGLDGLQDRINGSSFPFLSANMRKSEDGSQHECAEPFVIHDVNNVRVGIIGLTTMEADDINFPANVEGVDFIDYETALREVIPQVRAQNVDVIIIIAHMCSHDIIELAPLAAELGIALIGGGHCHERMAIMENDVALIEGGRYLSGYAMAVLDVDTASDTNKIVNLTTELNLGEEKDPETATIIQYWQDRLDEELMIPIGYLEQTVGRSSDPMFNLITDSWLRAFPSQISMVNLGGIRQDMPAGEITMATWVGILPFENFLYEIELTGSQIIASLGGMAVGGMTTIPDYALADGSPLDPDCIYSVLLTDYVYQTSEQLPIWDPEPYETSIHWRQPVIDWIRSLDTSVENPLDNYLDYTARQ